MSETQHPLMFPVLTTKRFVPWLFVAAHEKQAQVNHYQTVARLAERGGLCPSELVAVLENRAWTKMSDEAAFSRIDELLAAWAHDRRAPDPITERLADALRAARQFIENGIEMGAIRMPDMRDDPATKTPAIIDAALRAFEESRK